MDQLAALRTNAVADRYRSNPIEPERLERILATATDTPGFARQFPLRVLVIQDELTKRALRAACEAQRARWFHNVAEWLQKALVEAGEPRQLTVLTEAPCVVCVFGETEKPGWREAGWAASERLRVAAGAESLHAGVVHVDSLGFLNALLDVPATFTGVALLTLGEPESVRTPDPIHYDDLVIPYSPDAERLAAWNDPLKIQELARKAMPPARPFLSHKELMLNVIRTACEITNSRSLDHVFSLVTGQLRRLFRYDHASIGFLDPTDGKVRLRDVFKHNGSPVGEHQEIPLTEDNVIGWVILNKSGILRNEIAKDGMFTEQMSSESMQSDMIVPILSENTVLGTLNVGSATPNSFTQNDLDVLREFGKLIGGVVERLQASDRQRPIGVPAGVLSHCKFPAHLAVEVARCRDRGAACGLLIVSLDDPKGTDARAPEAEDAVQASVARVIRECTREIDILARVAGREFAVILPDVEAAGLPLVAERIRSAVQARVHTGDDTAMAVRITVSIGASLVDGVSAESAGLFEQAAAALRRAQGQGRNRFCIYDPEQDAAQAFGATSTSPNGA